MPDVSLPAPFCHDDSFPIYHGDCRELLPLIEFDAVQGHDVVAFRADHSSLHSRLVPGKQSASVR